jgi:hypothetical protein
MATFRLDNKYVLKFTSQINIISASALNQASRRGETAPIFLP